MKEKKLLYFFIIAFCFNMAASFAHPVTPTLIVERGLDSSMFGVALAAMMLMNFLFSPFWEKLCGYIPTKNVMLISCLGYAAGQIIFGTAGSEAVVIAGRMLAGVFVGGIYTALSNYVVNVSGSDITVRGTSLVVLTTVQNVGGACGYFVGGMLGIVSVLTAFIAQVAVLSLSGVCYYLVCMDDTPFKTRPEGPLRLKDANPFSAMLAARRFMTPALALIFVIVAVSAIGQNSYEQCFNYFIKDRFGMTSAYNGIFKAVIAALTLILNATVSLYLQRKTDVNRSFLYILAASTLLTGMALLCTDRVPFVAIYIIYSSVMYLRLPLLQTMCADRSSGSHSNQVMGFYQAMNSLGGIFGAFFAGMIYGAGAMLPFILAFAAFLIATLAGMVYRMRYSRKVD